MVQHEVQSDHNHLDASTLVINHGQTFGVFDRHGDIVPGRMQLLGIFHGGTRYVSRFQLNFGGHSPLLMSSTVREDNDILSVDLANPPCQLGSGEKLIDGQIHIRRTKFLRDGFCFEKIMLKSFLWKPINVPIRFKVEVDYRDIFEVRGIQRSSPMPAINCTRVDDKTIEFTYLGLDEIKRKTRFCSEIPCRFTNRGDLDFEIELLALGEFEFEYYLEFHTGPGQSTSRKSHSNELLQLESEKKGLRSGFAEIFTSNAQFNHWVTRSRVDLIALLSQVNGRHYPFAGVPWFNTVFGRDGLITAIETLGFAPFIAKEVLLYLAQNQAQATDTKAEAEPGKILHEVRQGELANIGEIPFKEYFGTVDATPLFVWLAGKYFSRTGDRTTIRFIWPQIKAAVKWLDHFGDSNRDGFVEYLKKTPQGLFNQGWKDSDDAISHEDGRLAEGPISLVEVQGYVYQAKLQAAHLAESFKEGAYASRLKIEARELRRNFNQKFWQEDQSYFCLALDGSGQPCRVFSSNPGHALATGIIDPKKARSVVEKLTSAELFNGWGIRTLSNRDRRYNPMSYHNGSVWPHDTALIAFGMARYGYKGAAHKVVQGLFDASLFLPLQRMPELFCGFPRRRGEAPTQYPVACSPQAWSVAAVYLLLQGLLGMEIETSEKTIYFNNPSLPDFIDQLSLSDLAVQNGFVDLRFVRYGHDVGVDIIQKPENWRIQIVKS